MTTEQLLYNSVSDYLFHDVFCFATYECCHPCLYFLLFSSNNIIINVLLQLLLVVFYCCHQCVVFILSNSRAGVDIQLWYINAKYQYLLHITIMDLEYT